MDSNVIIAGGGPVGMTLALELARHQVHSILLERNPTTTRHPKMDLTNGRSMELFRRLGIVDELRAVGVPPDQPLDIVWGTSLNGFMLHRFDYPTPDEKRAAAMRVNDGTHTTEPSMRVSQIILEPVLKAAIDASPYVDVRFGWAYEALSQDDARVSVTARHGETGEQKSLRASYLAGCDGGASKVRGALGIDLEGQAAMARAYMIHFRSDDRELLSRFGRGHAAYHFQSGRGSLIAQNGRDIWTVQSLLEPGTDESKLDPAAWLRWFVGRDFDFEVLVANPWSAHQVVAQAYRRGRVLLAGDAVHQVIPTGGYGMNTGIGDAVGLGWQLAAVVNGWAGPQMLDAYEMERRQIALQNRAGAQRHAEVRFAITEAFMEAERAGDLEAPEAEGHRAKLAGLIKGLGNAENESWGIEHGYRYEGSPVICYDEGTAPPFDPLFCTPTTWPGARLPSFFLDQHVTLYDRLGLEFTLLLVGDHDTTNFDQVACDAGIPVKVEHIRATTPATALLERNMVLVRPDQHVAWRGNAAPKNWGTVLSKVSGRPDW